jgi:hypothetical protein
MVKNSNVLEGDIRARNGQIIFRNEGSRDMLSHSKRWSLVTGLLVVTIVVASGCVSPARPAKKSVDGYEYYDRLGLPEEWQGTAGAEASFAPRTDLNEDGEMGSTELFSFVRGTGPMPWEGGFAITQFNMRYTDYDWDDDTRFFRKDNSDEPFDNMMQYRATWVQLQGLSEEGYGIAGVVSLGYSAETDADLEDGRSVFYALGGFMFFDDGVAFEDDSLMLAAGVAFADTIDVNDRDTTIFPGVQAMWTINDGTEVRLLANTLTLWYTFADHWRASFYTAYETTTFRTDQSLKKNGDKAVANDTYVPVMLRAHYQPTEYVDIIGGIGANLGRMITVDYGTRDEKDRVDTALAFELGVNFYF